MTLSRYRRWAETYDRRERGEALSPSESALLDLSSESEPAAAFELELRRELARVPCGAPETSLDGALVERVMREAPRAVNVIPLRPGIDRGQALGPDERQTPVTNASKTWGWIAGAASVAAGIWVVSSGWAWQEGETIAVTATQISEQTPAEVKLTFVSGSVKLDGKDVGDLSRTAVVTHSLRTGSGAACVSIDSSIDVCLGPDTEIELRELHRDRVVGLLRGSVVAALAKQPAGRHFRIEGARVRATAVGTVFGVEARAEGTTVTVLEGKVETETTERKVVLASHEQLRVGAGAEVHRASVEEESRAWALLAVTTHPKPAAVPVSTASAALTGDHEPSAVRGDSGEGRATLFTSAPVASAPELLRRARGLVQQGRWSAAADGYRALVTTHPKSAEAHTVLALLGQLQLDRLGQPRAALQSYAAYLSGGGPLAQEARFGSIRALRQLGDSARERAAIRGYLSAYPNGVDTPALKRRLSELAE